MLHSQNCASNNGSFVSCLQTLAEARLFLIHLVQFQLAVSRNIQVMRLLHATRNLTETVELMADDEAMIAPPLTSSYLILLCFEGLNTESL